MQQRCDQEGVLSAGITRILPTFALSMMGNDRIGGPKAPLLLPQNCDNSHMINAQDIRQWVESHLAESGGFLVDVHVAEGADIRVLVDAPEGMPISRCVAISRLIEDELDRDLYDFSLQVSTPGLDQPLKIRPQYEKNVGREVAVQLHDGHKIEGSLTAVADEGITVEHTEKRRIEGRKAKEWVTERHELGWDAIATTKVKISFKQ